MSYVANYHHKRKSLTQILGENCSTVADLKLDNPWIDLFWRAYGDQRYFLMLHILNCKILSTKVQLRWFDRVPYFSAKELFAMVILDMPQEYYVVISWIFDHIIFILSNQGINRALDVVNKISELLNLKRDQGLFENKDAVIYLVKYGLYDKSQNKNIKIIIKQKKQVLYSVYELKNSKLLPEKQEIKNKVQRVDSKMDYEPQIATDGTKKQVMFHLKSRFEFTGDPVSFEVCNYQGHLYFAIISGFRKDNNEIIVYQHDKLINRFKNYHSRPFTIIRLVPNTRFMVTADMSYDIALWDYIAGNCIAVWKFHSRLVNDLICVENGIKIYSCSSDNSVRCFKVPQSVSSLSNSNRKTAVRMQKLVFSLNYPSASAFCNEAIASISLGSIKNETIVFAGTIYAIRAYKERDMKLISVININDFKITHSVISKVKFINETNILAISKNQIKWVDIEEKKVLKTFSDRQTDENKILDVMVHPNNYFLAPSTIENPKESIIAWSLEGKPMKRLFSSDFQKIRQIHLLGTVLYAMTSNCSILKISIE